MQVKKNPFIKTSWLSLTLFYLVFYATASVLYAAPIIGPGMGNIAYNSDEAYQMIARIDRTNGVPAREEVKAAKVLGTNVALLVNGYFVTTYAPDSGSAGGGFLVYDISDPRKIKLINKMNVLDIRESHAIASTLINNQTVLVIQTVKGVSFWDFSDVKNIRKISELALPGVKGGDYVSVAWQLAWQGNYLYVTGGNLGLFIVDTQDIARPKLAPNLMGNPVPIPNLGGFRVGPVFAFGNQLLLSGMESTDPIAMYDISDPVNPVLISKASGFEKYYASCYDGNDVFLMARTPEGKLEGVNFRDAGAPKIISSLKSVPVKEGLYCSTQDKHVILGLQETVVKLDVSNITSPKIIGKGSLAVEHSDHGQVSIFGNLVYIGNDHGTGNGFWVHDIKPDKTPPAINRTSPLANSSAQATTSRIGIAFSDNIDLNSVNEQSFTVQSADGQVVEGVYSTLQGMVNFAPKNPLKTFETYTVTLKAGGIKDYAQNGLAQDVMYTFTTGDKSDQMTHFWPLVQSAHNQSSFVHGTPMGQVHFKTQTANFPGNSSDYIALNSDTSLQLGGTASMAFYIKTQQKGGATAETSPGVMGGKNTFQKDRSLYWGWLDAAGHIHLDVGQRQGVRSNQPINDNQWHHVVMSRDSETGQVQLFVDGQLQEQKQLLSGKLAASQGWSLYQIKPIKSAIETIEGIVNGIARIVPIKSMVQIACSNLKVLCDIDTFTIPQGELLLLDLIDDKLYQIGATQLLQSLVHGSAYQTIGRFGDTSAPTFKGQLADLRIYQKILKAEDIQKISSTAPIDIHMAGDNQGVVSIQTPIHISLKSLFNKTSDANVTIDFGDNSSVQVYKAGDNITHQYTEPGHYTVRFTIKTPNREKTLTETVAVVRPTTRTPVLRSHMIMVDKGMIYSVNPDNNSVSAFHANTHQKQWEIQVGAKPLSLGIDPMRRLWVTLQDDDKLATFSLNQNMNDPAKPPVVDLMALPYGSAPSDLVMLPNGQMLVTLEGRGEIIRVDTAQKSVVATGKINPDPKSIAVNLDKGLAYVARFRSSHEQGEVSVVALSDLKELKRITLAIDRRTIDGEDRARGIPNYLAHIAMTPDGQHLWVPSKKDNILRGLQRDGKALNHENTVRSIVSQIDLTTDQEDFSRQIDFNDRAPAKSVVFSPQGDYAFVILQNSNMVEIVDRYSGARLGGVTHVGLAPQDLVLDATTQKLWVSNLNSRDIYVFDVSGILKQKSYVLPRLAVVKAVAKETLPAAVLKGKQIFYNAADSRMNRDGYMSCASCHDDGGDDGMVWDFTNRGEGLRNTIALTSSRGGMGLLHWSGNFDELQDFEKDIRLGQGGTGFMQDADFKASDDPLGAKKVGKSEALDALAQYILSLNKTPRSPYREGDGRLTTLAQQGQNLFTRACAKCHTPPSYENNQTLDVGTIDSSSGKRLGQTLTGINVPSLLGVWKSAPYLHRGQAATIEEVVAGTHHGATLSANDQAALVQFVKSIDGQP